MLIKWLDEYKINTDESNEDKKPKVDKNAMVFYDRLSHHTKVPQDLHQSQQFKGEVTLKLLRANSIRPGGEVDSTFGFNPQTILIDKMLLDGVAGKETLDLLEGIER